MKGEELRKLIGAPVYIECSSKTQQVHTCSLNLLKVLKVKGSHDLIDVSLCIQNVKAVFDAAIKVVLQPPKQKKKEIEVTKQVAEYCRSSGTARKIGLILLRCRSTIVDEADPVDR